MGLEPDYNGLAEHGPEKDKTATVGHPLKILVVREINAPQQYYFILPGIVIPNKAEPTMKRRTKGYGNWVDSQWLKLLQQVEREGEGKEVE